MTTEAKTTDNNTKVQIRKKDTSPYRWQVYHMGVQLSLQSTSTLKIKRKFNLELTK